MLTADRQCEDMKIYSLTLTLIWLESRNHAGKKNGRRKVFPGKKEAAYIPTWGKLRLDWTKMVNRFCKLMQKMSLLVSGKQANK